MIVSYILRIEQHDKDVCWVLEQLALHKLYEAKNKCQFRTNSIDFLGYRISPAGVEMQEDKVEAIRTWPKPETPDDVTQFLGLANFYRRFIKNRRRRETPEVRTKEDTGGRYSFLGKEALKEAFITAPVLRHFDPAKPLRVETDASNRAVGSILCQPDEEGHWHPIAFLS